MSRFNVGFGQQLCDVLSAELGFVCNFMGDGGCIVASGERERIGSIHAIAAQIMRGEIDEYSVSKEEAAQSATMREGINMGIDVDGERLISFSVAGPLEVVRPLAHLVRFCVASLLRFRQESTLPELPADQFAAPVPNATSLLEMLSQAEFRVEERARELRNFAELSADWFWTQDAEFRFTGFSGLSTEKLQRKQSDFFGKRRWDMPIFGVSEAQLAEHIATCERHEPFRNFEYQIPSAEGVPQFYFISGTPVFNKQGVFTGYHGNGTNITDLRLAELAIKERERQLAQIVDGSPIPTFVIDAEHRVTHWNQACANLTGFSAHQMLGSNEVWRAFYPLPRPTMADLVLSGASDEVVSIDPA